MRIAIDVPVFRQATDCECGNTSLKSVLWYLGRRESADRLRKLCEVTRLGVDHQPLVDGARRLGANVFAKEEGTVEDLEWFLRRRLPVIVGWWSRDTASGDGHFRRDWTLAERKRRDCGHYSVVCGLSDAAITLMDPQQQLSRGHWRVVGKTAMQRPAFLDAWYDTDTPRYVKVERWMMVANLDGECFSSRVAGGRDYRPFQNRYQR